MGPEQRPQQCEQGFCAQDGSLSSSGQIPSNTTEHTASAPQTEFEDNFGIELPPPIAGGAPHLSESSNEGEGELEDPGNQPESVDYRSAYLDMKGIDWTQDLSSDGQWLFKELLIGAEDIRLLEQYAAADGVDLDAATRELDQYELIDRRDSGFLHLPWKKIPPPEDSG